MDKLFPDPKCELIYNHDYELVLSVMLSAQTTDKSVNKVTEKLYKEYPDYRETNNTFLANGKEILRFKTVNENRVGTGKPVMLVKPS